MRIGALSALTGLSRDTLRFYEREGLITSLPSTEPTNSYRNYPTDTAERLRMITDARDAGLSLSDLKFLLDYMESGRLGSVDVDAFLEERIAQLRQTILKAQTTLMMLEQTQVAIQPNKIAAKNSAKTL